jgi:hypothetical protein
MFCHPQLITEQIVVYRFFDELRDTCLVLRSRDGIHDENDSFHAAKVQKSSKFMVQSSKFFSQKEIFLIKKDFINENFCTFAA